MSPNIVPASDDSPCDSPLDRHPNRPEPLAQLNLPDFLEYLLDPEPLQPRLLGQGLIAPQGNKIIDLYVG